MRSRRGTAELHKDLPDLDLNLIFGYRNQLEELLPRLVHAVARGALTVLALLNEWEPVGSDRERPIRRADESDYDMIWRVMREKWNEFSSEHPPAEEPGREPISET